jgi:hypothetical protein
MLASMHKRHTIEPNWIQTAGIISCSEKNATATPINENE